MEHLINPKKKAEPKRNFNKDSSGVLKNSVLPDLVQDLNRSLTALQPNRSETTQIITYALLATAVVGIMVYHYIREQERAEDLKNQNG